MAVVALPKGVYDHKHIRPREYPPEIVELARSLYVEENKTIAEVQALLPKGYKAQRIIERHVAERRPAIIRDQRGAKNSAWKGDEATYQAFHLRVQSARGKPSLCAACGCTEGKFEWANLTARYEDINDYIRLCVPCHRRFDSDRRIRTGRSTREKVMPYV